MKAIVLSAFLAVAGALAIGAQHMGYVNFTKIPEELIPLLQEAELMDEDPRHIVIGLDITAGREGELEKDRQAIITILKNVRLNDIIEIYLIHSRAESEQEAVFAAQMPQYPGPAGQEFIRAKQKAEKEWAACWDTIMKCGKDPGKIQQTDLFGFFRFVTSQKPEFRAHKHPYLIMFTDGQQVGDGFNMEKKAPHTEQLLKIKSDILPNLNGINIYFAGVTPTHKITNAHWRQIKTFWTKFAKITGAKSVSVTSDRPSMLKVSDNSPQEGIAANYQAPKL